MKYTIRHVGVPIGSVELSPSELISAGVLRPTDAYANIQQTVRDGSAALLRLGFFGAAVQAAATQTGSSSPALRAAALLSLEMVDSEGKDVPATFINLIEPPNDSRVVVMARLSHAHARVPAINPPGKLRGSDSEMESDD